MKLLFSCRLVLLTFGFVITSVCQSQSNFTKYNNGIAPVLEKSPDIINDWDATAVADADVVFYLDTFRLWYTSSGYPDYTSMRIGYAWSLDGINWTKHDTLPVLTGTPGDWDSLAVETATVIVDTLAPTNERYKMWYVGTTNNQLPMYYDMGYAYSPNGYDWTKFSGNPVLQADTTTFPSIDYFGFEGPTVVFENGTYHMWYTCIPAFPSGHWNVKGNIAYASSSDGINWTKKTDEPALKVGENTWDTLFVQTPDIVKIGNIYHMYYSGSNSDSTMQTSGGGWHYRIGYAWADENDIHNWTKNPTPILMNGQSDAWDGASVAFPSILYLNNSLHLWYTGQNICVNDTSCVWPDTTFWDTGYAVDSSPFIGLQEVSKQTQTLDELNIYPNPANESFQIMNFESPLSLRLYDGFGQLLFSKEMYNNEAVNISELRSGIYIVQIKKENSFRSMRLVKL